jgi:uncharacterized protein YndB with AHSA1/START domain
MAEVHITRDFDKPADEVWDLIGDFHGIHKFNPTIQPTESLDGGTARKIVMGPNAIVERLVEQTDRSYTYSMDDDGPLPVKNYRSTLSVKDAGGGKSTVDWKGTFDPADPNNTDGAVQIVTMVYTGGLDSIEKTLSS